MQPDLILLDVGLPKLNGIEAAQRICKVAPKSKILFLTQETDVDVAHVALTYGHGYVLKSDAGNKLFAAIEVVMQGEKFRKPQIGGGLLRPRVNYRNRSLPQKCCA